MGSQTMHSNVTRHASRDLFFYLVSSPISTKHRHMSIVDAKKKYNNNTNNVRYTISPFTGWWRFPKSLNDIISSNRTT